jgi:NADH-quinone oxidoreductase subunit F
MEKLLSRNWGIPDSWTIGVYEQRGGYQALRKGLRMEPKAIVQEVIDSNLRGRGGAGFPCGRKWTFLKQDTNLPKYLVINGDEGEPGTFKDREIIGKDPHSLIEGCILSCFALGANTCYIYLRGEFVLGARRMEQAIAEAHAKGYLGKNILGSGFNLEIYVHRGAGAYICGEETALLNSLEGYRGEPRLKPPFPAVAGAFGCPTIVNNVETIATVPFIVERGGKWYADQGTATDGGLRLYCISGHVKRPGVYELSTKTTLHDMIYEFAGGMLHADKALKGVIPGGSSTPVLLPHEIKVAMEGDALKKLGSATGSAGIIVMDESTCMVRAGLRLAKFYHHESCGQCTPCREGTGWLERIFHRIEHGEGTARDLEVLFEAANNMEGNTICPLADAAAWPTKAFLKKYPDEFKEHIRLGHCPFPEYS